MSAVFAPTELPVKEPKEATEMFNDFSTNRRTPGWKAGRITLALLAGLGALLGSMSRGSAQVASMKYDGRRTLALKDGTQVTVLHALTSTQDKPQYYYLPTNLRIAPGPDGTPQFLFMKFTTDKADANGGVSGGLLHFLMEFGLTQQQQAELAAMLKQSQPAAELLGAAPVVPDGETGTFQITSATLSDQTLTKSLITSGKVPLLPGQRVAAAARLTAPGAALLASTLEKGRSITDVSLSFNLAYYTQVPALNASMTFHAERLQRERERLDVEYTKKTTGHLWWKEHQYTYKEAYEMLKFLGENQLIEVKIDQRVDNEAANKIRDAFLQMFLDSMTQKQQVTPEQALADPNRDKSSDKDPKAPAVGGSSYTLNRYRFTDLHEVKDRTWRFSAYVPVREVMPLTGNLATWYNAVRDNPKCVASVNLDLRFFSKRDVKLILDLDAKEIFDEAVNYVTVNVRKKRSSGVPFQESVTLDSKFVKENGITATVTYARGDDQNADTYEYQAQWSLKGGVVYPQNPAWEKGEWEGVTLKPPVRPFTIEVQCDPEELKSKDITRCTAQVRYYQFGQEAEANIPITPAKNEQVVARKLFRDRDRSGYAYRLVWNHKSAGRLVGPWVRDASDDYIYAAVPGDLLTDEGYKSRGANSGSDRVLSTR